MASARPSKAPSADFSALVNRVSALSEKAGLGPLAPGALKLPLWKRWVEGNKPEYNSIESGALRVVVNANAEFLDEVKGNVDVHTERLNSQAARIAALEAQPSTSPFPE
jgi:hypothetical protein